MSVIGSNVLAGASGGAGAAGFAIERSLRFNSGDSAYLNRTPSSAGNRRTWTWSCWIKRNNVSSAQNIFVGSDNPTKNNTTFSAFYFHPNNQIYFGGWNSPYIITDAVYRDASAWYHIVLSVDTAQSTSTDRIKVYVNNVLQSYSTGAGFPGQNTDLGINQAYPHYIGGNDPASGYASHMYAEINFVDGSQLDPTSFGAFDDNGVWQAKDTAGLTFGTNGFRLKLADNSSNAALGTDSSGNSNTWTVNNLVAIVPTVQYGEDTSNSNFDSSSTSLTYDTTGFTYNNVSSPKTDTGQANASTVLKSANGSAISWTFSTNSTDRYIWTSNNGINWSSTGSTYPVSSSPQTVTAAWVAWAGGSNASTLTITFGSASDIDSLVDSPTNGDQTDTGAGGEITGCYATLNPLAKASNFVTTNGNLAIGASGGVGACLATIAYPKSGKWYHEIVFDSVPGYNHVGVARDDTALTGNPGYDTTRQWTYWQNGNKTNGATYGASFAGGDVIGVAFDADAGSLTFYKNGVSQGVNATGLTSTTYNYFSYFPCFTFAANINFGQRAFSYPVSGYKSLNTANLPTPTIADGSKYFDSTIYTGNGSGQTITLTNSGFSPDWVWIKSRNQSANHWLIDVVRGADQRLITSGTQAEASGGSSVVSFTSTGFVLGTDSFSSTNENNDTYVAWTWDAGANSDKTYTVTVSGGNFYIDGAQQPTLTLAEGSTYKFDQSASTNATHPLRFSTTSDGTHGSGTEYTTGVTTAGTPGSAGAYTQIVIAASAPTLYAYCTNHSGMGFQVNTSDTGGATNLDGTIASQVMASPESGFSIVSYTGSGSNATVGHGLNAATAFYIVKRRDGSAGNWQVYHGALGATYYGALNSTDAFVTAGGTSRWNDTAPTSSVFSVGTSANVNASGGTYIAYCFAPVAGHSAMGKFIGNGSTSGPFVYTGFRPAFVMIKPLYAYDGGGSIIASTSWYMYDSARGTYNANGDILAANKSFAEENNATDIDFLSNGFKLRNARSINTSSGAIYYAVAENPFQANGGLAR